MVKIRHLLSGLLVMVALGGTIANAASTDRPNILFITVDDLNNDLGTYGHPLVRSPHIDALAQAGVRFDRAYNQAPLCTPSRSSFMTGLYPDQTGIVAHGSHTRLTPHFRDHIPGVTTLPQLFRDNGYFTGRVGKIYHQGVPAQIGTPGGDDPASWDVTVNPSGIDREVEDRIKAFNETARENRNFGGTLSWLAVDSTDDEHTDGIIATETIKMMRDHHPDKTGVPFFLGVGFYRPHTPYVAPTHYFDWYPLEDIDPFIAPADDRDDIPPIAYSVRDDEKDLTLDQRREVIQAYYASISLMDAQVGRVIAALEEMGLADDTIVVFLSDHGYHLGSHDQWQKQSLFEEAARVPLIIAMPGQSANGRPAPGLVELVDIYPTLAALAGLTGPDYLQGVNLAPMLKDPDERVRDSAYSSLLSVFRGENDEFAYTKIRGHSVRTERYRYTEWADGMFGAELYDYENDPNELTNLAARAPHESVRVRLKWMLDDRVAQASKRVRSIETNPSQ